MPPSPKVASKAQPPNVQLPLPLPGRKLSQLVQYQDEYEQRDASLQIEWSALMEEGSGNKSSLYKKVKALVISWDEEIDDLKTKAEVFFEANLLRPLQSC